MSNTPVPSTLRCNLGRLRLCTATTARDHVTRLPRRGVALRSKSTPTACSANSDTGNAPVHKTAQDFLAVASRASPFQDVGDTILTDLCSKGQEETRPVGYRLSEEGAAPTACHVLLHSCFLKSNGEGTCSLTLHLWHSLHNQPCITADIRSKQGIVSWGYLIKSKPFVMQPLKPKLAGLST